MKEAEGYGIPELEQGQRQLEEFLQENPCAAWGMHCAFVILARATGANNRRSNELASNYMATVYSIDTGAFGELSVEAVEEAIKD